MTNLRTDEMAFFHSLKKIGTDENKAIYSMLKYMYLQHLLSQARFSSVNQT